MPGNMFDIGMAARVRPEKVSGLPGESLTPRRMLRSVSWMKPGTESMKNAAMRGLTLKRP